MRALTESEVREQTDANYWQVVSLRHNLSTIEAVERQLEEIHRQVELSVKAGLVATNELLRGIRSFFGRKASRTAWVPITKTSRTTITQPSTARGRSRPRARG